MVSYKISRFVKRRAAGHGFWLCNTRERERESLRLRLAAGTGKLVRFGFPRAVLHTRRKVKKVKWISKERRGRALASARKRNPAKRNRCLRRSLYRTVIELRRNKLSVANARISPVSRPTLPHPLPSFLIYFRNSAPNARFNCVSILGETDSKYLCLRPSVDPPEGSGKRISQISRIIDINRERFDSISANWKSHAATENFQFETRSRGVFFFFSFFFFAGWRWFPSGFRSISRGRAPFNFRGTSTPCNKIDISAKARPPDQACIIRSIRRIKRRRRKKRKGGGSYRERERLSTRPSFYHQLLFRRVKLERPQKSVLAKDFTRVSCLRRGCLLREDSAHKEFVKRAVMVQNGWSMGLGFFARIRKVTFRQDVKSGEI